MVCRTQKRVRLNGNGRSGFLHFIQRAHKEGLFRVTARRMARLFTLYEQADISPGSLITCLTQAIVPT